MEKSSLRLAVELIKATTAFQIGQVEYEKGDDQVRVWSTDSTYGNFHATCIVPLLQGIFSIFLTWNREENRVELHIF